MSGVTDEMVERAAEVLWQTESMRAALAAVMPDVVAAERFGAVVRNIASQKMVDEMTGGEYSRADFEGAYEAMIEIARHAIAEPPADG